MQKSLTELIDISIRPKIYRASNPEFIGKIAIDFACDNGLTIAPFESLSHAKLFLINKFGQQQFNEWFPGGLRDINL
jgi:hypothetical protein